MSLADAAGTSSIAFHAALLGRTGPQMPHPSEAMGGRCAAVRVGPAADLAYDVLRLRDAMEDRLTERGEEDCTVVLVMISEDR